MTPSAALFVLATQPAAPARLQFTVDLRDTAHHVFAVSLTVEPIWEALRVSRERRYVWGAERPPLKEYYAKLGFTLVEDDKGAPARFELDPNATPEQLALRRAWMGDRARLQ